MVIEEKVRIHKILAESLVTKLSLYSKLDTVEIPNFCRNLIKTIGSSDFDIECINHAFILMIDPFGEIQIPLVNVFSPGELNILLEEQMSAESNVFKIDLKGNYIGKVNQFIDDKADEFIFKPEANSVLFFVTKRQIATFVEGRNIDNILNTSSYKPPGFISGSEYHIEDWGKLVDKFYQEVLREQKGIYYWANKNNYLLLSSPERHFRKHLVAFLKDNTIGCVVDEEIGVDMGDNRTDIRVITTFDSQVYYFELKCMGRCESDTEYGDDHVNAGLKQVNEYVTSDSKCVTGSLIVFDGRKAKVDINWLQEIINELHNFVKDPCIIPLDPTSASTKGKMLVAEIKRSKKKS